MIPIPFVMPDARRKNEARRPPGAKYQCIVCGSWTSGDPLHWVHVHDGGSSIVTEVEASTMGSEADLGMQPVGSCCLKRHPQIREYDQGRLPPT